MVRPNIRPTKGYAFEYRQSLERPEDFWGAQAASIDWTGIARTIFDGASGPYGRWFADGECNACFNVVDRHVRDRGTQAALIYDSPLAGTKRSISYAELLDDVSVMGAILTSLGVSPGDRVIIYMPMIPEAVTAMLACARIGAVHSVVFGGFAAKELAARIEDAQPAVILSASCGIEPARIVPYKPLLDEAVAQSSHKPRSCIILQREQLCAQLDEERDYDWGALVAKAREAGLSSECVSRRATDPLYILYTSGTTGNPKGVVRDTGGYLVALGWSMKAIYNLDPGDVFWCASDIGWVVGHSYIVYGPLLHGCTTLLYEGKPVGTPGPGSYWRVIEEHGVKAVFTAPTALRAIRKEDPAGQEARHHDLTSLKAVYLAGERADPDTVRWAENLLDVPIIDHWWQTETGWAIAATPLGFGEHQVKHGSPGIPMPGYDIHILDEGGRPLSPGSMGTIAIRLPLPPGNLPTLWQAEERFCEAYLEQFPGFYTTSDAGYLDEDGYVHVMGRTDDIINVAGHRLSTGAMEEVLASHTDVAECAVIGIADALKGEVPCGIVVLKVGVEQAYDQLQKELVAKVRDQIGPVAAFKQVIVVSRLPKTRSGKILRGTMKKIAEGQDWGMPATIEDPIVLDEIIAAFRPEA